MFFMRAVDGALSASEVVVTAYPVAAMQGEIVDGDAVEIGALYEKARSSIVESVRYQIECGQRLADKKASLAHGEWLAWLKANAGVLGFETRRTAAMLMAAARTSNEKPASHLAPNEAVQISRQTWGHSNTIATKHTGDQESYTPAKYVDAARAAMGGIDLDPASNPLAQETVQAAEWHGKDTDGLGPEWAGRVFLNPPYSHPEIALFIEKLCASYSSGAVTQAVLLTNNNTDTKWWHRVAGMASAVCFTAGRINFYKEDGSETQPTNGQTFFFLGKDASGFAREFAPFGLIMAATGEC